MVELRKSCTKACNSLGTFPLEVRNVLWNVTPWHDSCGFHRRAVVDLPITCSENVLRKYAIFDWKFKSLCRAGWLAAGMQNCGKIAGFLFQCIENPYKKTVDLKIIVFFCTFCRGRRRTTPDDGDPSENGEMDYGNRKIYQYRFSFFSHFLQSSRCGAVAEAGGPPEDGRPPQQFQRKRGNGLQ